MLLIVAALAEEVSGVLHAGRYDTVDAPGDMVAYQRRDDRPTHGQQVMVVLSGTGRKRASEAARWAISQHAPDAVLSTGFAGGTYPTLRPGDLILARELYRLDGSPFYWGQDQLGDPILPDHALMAQARNAVEMAGIDSRLGSPISLPVVAKTAGMKVWIGERLGALGVDMESYSIGEEADRAQIPFAAVRSVVDSVSVNLPDLVGQVDQQPTGGRLVPAMKYLLRHPLGIGPLAQLGRSAGTARNSLTIFCSEFIAEMDSDRESSPPGVAA